MSQQDILAQFQNYSFHHPNPAKMQVTVKRRTRLERALNDGQVELAEDIYFSANGRQWAVAWRQSLG